MRHILIGGNGFLGRELVRQIQGRSGDTAVVVDMDDSFENFPERARAGISYHRADVSIPGALDGLELTEDDVVHHLATRLITPNRPRFGRDDHFNICAVGGTTQILKWMKNKGNRRLVFWSTDMVYGPAVVVPRTEKHPRRPFGPYGRSKVAAEDIIARSVAAGDVSCTIFRPRLILGPGRLGILEVLFRLIERGRPVPLIGRGTNRFQFVSVADCARASLGAADHGCPNGVYNLGSENSPLVIDLMTDFLKATGSRSRIIKTPATLVKGLLRTLNLLKLSPMDPEQYEIADLDVSLDTTAVTRDLGWRPRHQDLDLLLAAYRSWRGEDVRLP